jgi:hypothetical protein
VRPTSGRNRLDFAADTIEPQTARLDGYGDNVDASLS